MADKSGQNPLKDLSFNVEANHDEKALVNQSSDAPIHVRVKVHNRNDPKVGNNYWLSLPDSKSKILKHSASDQTILSFKLLMQPDLDKNTSRRPRKSFINRLLPGVCLGIPNSDDEGPYMPGVPCLDDNNVIFKPGTTPAGVKQRQKNKYKPGGCLDPPFGEERYAYAPTKKVPISEENSKNNVLNKGDILIPKDTKSSDQISFKSLGLITYPESTPTSDIDKDTALTMSEIPDQKRKISQYSESAEMYFIPAKAKDTEESPADESPIKGLIPNVLGAVGTATEAGLKAISKYNENDDEWTAITNKPLLTQYGHAADNKSLEEPFEQIILEPGKLATTGFKTTYDKDTVGQRPNKDIDYPSTFLETKSFGSTDKLDVNENIDSSQVTLERQVSTDSFAKDNPETIENITPDDLTPGKYLISDSEIINEDGNRGQRNIVTGIIGAISGVLAEPHDGKQTIKDKQVVSDVTSYLRYGDNKDSVKNSQDSLDTKNEQENVYNLTHVEGQDKNENNLKNLMSQSIKSDEFIAGISLHSASSKGQAENETIALREQDGYSVDILKKSGIGITKSRLESGSKEPLENTEKHLLDEKIGNVADTPDFQEQKRKEKQDDEFAGESMKTLERVLQSRHESTSSDEHMSDSDNLKEDQIKVYTHQEYVDSKDEQANVKICFSDKNEDDFASTLREDKLEGKLSHQESKYSKEQPEEASVFSNKKEDHTVKVTQEPVEKQEKTIAENNYSNIEDYQPIETSKEEKVRVIQYGQQSTSSREQLSVDNYEELRADSVSDTRYQHEVTDSKDKEIYLRTKEEEYIGDQFIEDGARILQSRQESIGSNKQQAGAVTHSGENVISEKVRLTQSRQESTGIKEHKENYDLGKEEDKNFDKFKEDVVRITSCDVSNLNIIDQDNNLIKSKGISSKKELLSTIIKPVSSSLNDDVIRDSTSFASDVIKTAKPIHISTSDVHLGTGVEEDFDSSNFETSDDLTQITEHEDDPSIYEHRNLENNLPVIDERISENDTNADIDYLKMKKDVLLSQKKDQSSAKSGYISLQSSDNKLYKATVREGDKIDHILIGQTPHHPETEKGAQDYTSIRRIASSSIASSITTNSQTSINRQHHQIYKYRFDTSQKFNRKENSNVKMDIAFKTYIDKNKHIVLRTIDPRTIDANRTENITKRKITSFSEDVEIPINSSNKLLMRLKPSTSKVQGDKTMKLNRTLRSSSMNDFTSEEKINEKRNLTAINKCLGVIYEQQLVPLQKTINNLKEELQSLTLQQSMLTQKMVNYEKSKAMRITSKNRKCGCQHN